MDPSRIYLAVIVGQNWVYGEDLRSLSSKTKNRGNNHLSSRFGKYSFYLSPEDPGLGTLCLSFICIWTPAGAYPQPSQS